MRADLIAIPVITALVVGVCWLAYYTAELEVRACTALGGKLSSKSISGVGISTSGSVVPTFSTVTFCLSADGRILGQ